MGRDSLVRSMLACMRCFNPRARVGRDDFFCRDGIFWLEVSIHAPAWGATRVLIVLVSRSSGFNPRARVGRDNDGFILGRFRLSFNPRARVGRDANAAARIARIQSVSIHAPAWGATADARLRQGCQCSFNPRARVGRDV